MDIPSARIGGGCNVRSQSLPSTIFVLQAEKSLADGEAFSYQVTGT